jgi:putative flippase GtrA
MKKIDYILAVVSGFGLGILMAWMIKGFGIIMPALNFILPVLFPILAVFCIWICYLIGKKYLFVFQLGKFLLIGIFFALVDLVFLNILLEVFHITKGTTYSVLVWVSFVVATCIKYVADKYWAFEKKEGKEIGSEFGKFFVITFISGFIQTGIASFVVNTLGPQFGASAMVWANVGKILGIAVASVWNFVGYKFVVFKK